MSEAADLLVGISTLVGVLTAVIVLVANRKGVSRLFSSASRVQVGGIIDIELTKDAVASARADAPPPSAVQLTAVARRLDREAPQLRGLRVLWVDDEPGNNSTERRILRGVGVHIDPTTTTDDALAMLAKDDYDLVITDIRRGAEADAGLAMARKIRAAGYRMPIVGYVGSVRSDLPVPLEFRALVVPVDELLHQVMDVAARRPDISIS